MDSWITFDLQQCIFITHIKYTLDYIWALICIMKNSVQIESHQHLLLIMTAPLQSDLWLCLVFHNSQKQLFSFATDDGHRVVLKSISEGVDCEHDYINATYIDVRNT